MPDGPNDFDALGEVEQPQPAPDAPQQLSTEDLVQIVLWSTKNAATLAAQPHRVPVQTTNAFGDPVTEYQDTGVGGQFADVLALGTMALAQLDRTTVSSSTAASIAQARDALAQSAQQFNMNYRRQLGRDAVEDEQWGKTFQQSERILGEQQRGNNLRATLDMLQQEIAIGNLDADEATTRVQAATNAADLQRNVLADWGGRALPAGTQYFPGSEPGGPLATAAAAIGGSFPGFKTMGTFGVDPAALGSTITAAQGPSAVPNAQDALKRAAAALAGMGVR